MDSIYSLYIYNFCFESLLAGSDLMSQQVKTNSKPCSTPIVVLYIFHRRQQERRSFTEAGLAGSTKTYLRRQLGRHFMLALSKYIAFG